MRKLVAVVAFSTVLAAPAFAQQANGRQDHRASQSQLSTVHPYAADRYVVPQYENNNNTNPDFQLGGER